MKGFKTDAKKVGVIVVGVLIALSVNAIFGVTETVKKQANKLKS